MAINYTDLCAQNMGNTGVEDCRIIPELFKGFLLAPASLAFTAANIADDTTFVGVLQTASTAAKASRVFPFLGADAIVSITDNTADPTLDNAGSGALMGVTFMKHSYTIRLGNYGMHLIQQFYKYNGQKNMAIAFIDAKGKLFGKKSGTGAKFMPCQIVTNQIKVAGDATAMINTIQVILTETDALMNQDKLFVYPFASSVILSDVLSGVHDVVLTEGTTTQSTTNVYFKATMPANFIDFATTYKAEIEAADGDCLVITDKADSSAVSVSAVAVSALGEISATSTYASGHTYYVSFATPAALIALSSPIGSATAGGYESNVIEISIP